MRLTDALYPTKNRPSLCVGWAGQSDINANLSKVDRSQRAARAATRTVGQHPNRAMRLKAPLRMALMPQSVFMPMHGRGANPA